MPALTQLMRVKCKALQDYIVQSVGWKLTAEDKQKVVSKSLPMFRQNEQSAHL